MKILAFWLWLCISPVLSYAQNSSSQPIRTFCGKAETKGKKWSYCLHQYNNSSRNVLYYLHGLFGSERNWKNNGLEKGIVERWVERGQRPPVVVSISFGPIWLLAEKNKSQFSGLYETFMSDVIPFLQNKVLAFKAEENWLMGVSMGGFNASQIYFKHPYRFSKTAMICGAMTSVSPYAPKKDLDDYTKRTKANPLLVWLSIQIAKAHFPSPWDWSVHSPVEMAARYFHPLSPPLYIANGTGDEFGFHEGNIIMAELAKLSGFPVPADFYPGNGHCYIDPKPVADFFMNSGPWLSASH